MKAVLSRIRPKALLLPLSGILVLGLQLRPCLAAGYGSLAGVVSDNRGVPLMGATVVVLGPTAFDAVTTTQTVERMITDAHGRFRISHLVPGWYSLKISSPTRLPVMRNGVRVAAGETVVASFVLTDVLAPVHFQVPSNSVSSWGDDWKWVLRTSSTTRPILRLREPGKTSQAASQDATPQPKKSERIVGILPGSAPRDPLAEDFGMASVFAYVQPVSADSDVLAASSFAPYGTGAGTVGAALMRNQVEGDPQQFGLVFHQMSLAPSGSEPSALAEARGLTATYSETRLIVPKVTVTAGMEINYLSAVDSVFSAQPRIDMEYQATAQTVLAAEFGSGRADETADSALERLALLNAFPQITLRDGRLAMEQLNHTELSVIHRMGRSARVQAAAYHDSLRNSAVWAWGHSADSATFAGYSLPNPAGTGVVINGGNVQSVGFRAVFSKNFGSRVEVLGAYSSGSALAARAFVLQNSRFCSNGLQPEQTNSFVGKITADVPGTHTRFSASYDWVPNDRVTLVDPAGLANMQVQPYLGLQVRQPIPTPGFLPVHIDAVAEFQNLLSQGYVPATQGSQKPVVLSSGYHYVRGGFSVQF